MASSHSQFWNCCLSIFAAALLLSAAAQEPSASPSPQPPADIITPLPSSPSPSPAPNFSPPAPPPLDISPNSNSPTPALSPSKSPSPAPVANDGVTHENKPDIDDLDSSEKSSSGMSGWQKAGVAIGVIAAVCVLGVGGFIYNKRQQNLRRAQFGSAGRGGFV